MDTPHAIEAGDHSTVFYIGNIEGNANIDALPSLTTALLTKPAATRPPLDADSLTDLLRVQEQRTPFLGRDKELAYLRAWAESEAPLSILTLVGEAGRGKSRLALEFGQGLAEEGWRAFRIVEPALAGLSHAGAARLSLGEKTLLLLDNAAQYAPQLAIVLQSFAEKVREGKNLGHLRLLLIDRHASEAPEGWLTKLRQGPLSGLSVQQFFAAAPRYELAPLDDLKARHAIFSNVVTQAAEALGKEIPPLPALGDDEVFDKRLRGQGAAREVLYLVPTAIEVARQGVTQALQRGAREAMLALGASEVRRLDDYAKAQGLRQPNGLAQLLAAISLRGGIALEDLEKLVVDLGLAPQAGPQSDAYVRALTSHLGVDSSARLAPLQPDVFAAAFFLSLATNPPVLGSRLIARAGAGVEQAAAVFVFLAKAAQDFAHVAVGPGDSAPHRKVLLQWLQDSAQGIETPEQLIALDNWLGDLQAEPLFAVHLALTERLVAVLSAREDEKLAAAKNNLANILSDLGQREAALQAAQEALALYRSLDDERLEAFRPDLARSLNNLGNRLSELGQREAALQAAQEAVALYRSLAAERPEAFRPDLAMSLNNLANRLSELGQREAALQAAQEAVTLYRRLAAERPEAFGSYLALSLNNLAIKLSGLGQREAALQAAQEAVALYRSLAAERPEAFRPDLAMSLNNLASFLSDLGQREAALQAAQEAVELYRSLAAERPEAFEPDLAMSLNNLGNRLSDLGQREAALQAAQEAVELRRRLAAERPEAFRPDLAMSLNTLANILSNLGQREAALQAAQEALALYRSLAAERPEAFGPDLAMSLNNLAIRYFENEHPGESQESVAEACSLYHDLATSHPLVFLPAYSNALALQATICKNLDQATEAQSLFQQSLAQVQAYRKLAPDIDETQLHYRFKVLQQTSSNQGLAHD